jgi:hypothetical protein
MLSMLGLLRGEHSRQAVISAQPRSQVYTAVLTVALKWPRAQLHACVCVVLNVKQAQKMHLCPSLVM